MLCRRLSSFNLLMTPSDVMLDVREPGLGLHWHMRTCYALL